MPYGQSGFFLSFSFSLLAVTLDDAAAGFAVGFAGSFLVDGLLSTLLVATSTVSLVVAFYMYRMSSIYMYMYIAPLLFPIYDIIKQTFMSKETLYYNHVYFLQTENVHHCF